jgi:hypothetical protein
MLGGGGLKRLRARLGCRAIGDVNETDSLLLVFICVSASERTDVSK